MLVPLPAMLVMPLVLNCHGLADKKLLAFNSLEPNPRRGVKDPFPQLIMTYNLYLHWKMLYRARFLTEAEVKHMDEKGHAVLHSLVKTFPQGLTLKNGCFRSALCTGKQH